MDIIFYVKLKLHTFSAKTEFTSQCGIFGILDHFYATTKITQDKENTIITGGTAPGDNEPRQFRMKLPDKTIIAFLAVGIK